MPGQELCEELSAWEAGLAARFGNWGLPAMGWHYWGRHSAGHGPALPKHKKPRPRPGLFMQLVPETGVEPATYALRMRRSTN
ncbi:protein of unknown function [Stenotrophomonas maltophilia]|nr:protein of unknown function [Stenotrophomonas maltophilia]